TTPTTPTTPTPGTTNPTAQALLNQASQKFADADTALRNGDLATYQIDIGQAEAFVRQAQSLLGGSGSTPSTTPFTSASAAALVGHP
ncbi:MAG TPA: hypothetical protein VLV81_04475, partial [Acidimicrobiia bacterium]|nr:hypothetical protein [Acidimicrobiia bacterium]